MGDRRVLLKTLLVEIHDRLIKKEVG